MTEPDPVAAQYETWVYPQPVLDMAEAVAKNHYFDVSDPALIRRKLWPKRVEPDDLDILIAGCGANQAAYFAHMNPRSRVVGIDISEASLEHERRLKAQHNLDNLELHRLDLEQTASLGMTFDLIVSTGVLHHLPDPGAGLRHLRDALKPRGVMTLMLYGLYPRIGVHMLQEAFRILGLRQDAAGVSMVRHTLDNVLPRWHHLDSYRDPDRGFDAGLVDTYLHPRERAYTVPQVLALIAESQLKFQSWLDNLDYAVSFGIPNSRDPVRKLIETLPIVDRWRLVELLGQSMARHFVLVCHPDRPETDYTLDFDGQGWLDYVPSLRLPITIQRGERVESHDRPPVSTTSMRRFGHRVELDAHEAALLKRVDGKRPVVEIIEEDAFDEADALPRIQRAREFFQRMAEWDYLLFEIP